MILTVIIIGGEPQHTARIACDFRVSVRALSGTDIVAQVRQQVRPAPLTAAQARTIFRE
jgi:hypothetical protein